MSFSGSGEYCMLCPHADCQSDPVHRFRSPEGQRETGMHERMNK